MGESSASQTARTNLTAARFGLAVAIIVVTSLLLFAFFNVWRFVQMPRFGKSESAAHLAMTLPKAAASQPEAASPDKKDKSGSKATVMAVGKLKNAANKATEVRFKFTIDPNTPAKDLLPDAPKIANFQPRFITKLSDVPEISFRARLPKSIAPMEAKKLNAHQIAKINHLNAKETDGFMVALLKNRRDLDGLPFRMGKECRMNLEQSAEFKTAVERFRPLRIWKMFAEGFVRDDVKRGQLYRARISALMQIFGPSKSMRRALVQELWAIPHPDATRALAKVVLFSPEPNVRQAAIQGLRVRRERDYTEVLLSGFHHPWPEAAANASEALVQLGRKDLLSEIISVLNQPDPRLPVRKSDTDKETFVARDMVRINHHRNCLLCHPPGNTKDVDSKTTVIAEVPTPGESFPSESSGGYRSSPQSIHPDLVVRADVTYLRQDFSRMMTVKDAHPWPAMQRFDFVVRTREITKDEAQGWLELAHEEEQRGYISPYKRAAHKALVWLTGHDAPPDAEAWQKLIAAK